MHKTINTILFVPKAT